MIRVRAALLAAMILVIMLLTACDSTVITAPTAPHEGCIWAHATIKGTPHYGWMCPQGSQGP